MPPIAALALLALPQVPAPEDVPLTSGLTVRLFQLDVADLVELPVLVPDQTPNRDVVVPTLQLVTDDFEGLTAPLVTRALGWLRVEQAGEHAFRLLSDDGSRLTLDGELLIDHDGRHGSVPKDSDAIALEPGYHSLSIEHFDSGGASSLRLEWRPPGTAEFELVPSAALFTEDDPTRVTAPGVKHVVDDRKPGTGLPVAGVHPAYRIEDLRPAGFEPKVGALCFLPDGRLALGTFDPLQRDERELPDIESKPPDTIFALDVDTLELTEIASDVYEPSGLCMADGELYVSHRRAIDRLRDLDGDGFFETHETVGEGWEGWNYHQFVFGLAHADGNLFATLSTTMAPPAWEGMETNSGPNGPLRGGILEIDLSSNDTRVIAGGTRTPNGIGHLADGTLIYLDNQGSWMPASVLAEVVPGAFYGHYNWTRFVPKLAERYPTGGHPSVFADRERMAPALWLPQNEVVNSPTQPVPFIHPSYPGTQALIGELTAGGVRRVAFERVDSVLQGALFRFSQGFEAGLNRMVWGPDGALYTGGMGAGGNWNWKGTQFGLQRMLPTGRVPFEMAAVKALPDGFELSFTEPVGDGWLEDLENFSVTSWTYTPTGEYGGPKIDEREHRVAALEPARDRRSVRVALEGLEPGRCVHLAFDAESVGGERIWSGETWYTLNRIPDAKGSAGGLEPLSGASHLMPRGVPVQLWQSGSHPPQANRTQDELMAEPWFELRAGDAPLESSVEFGAAVLELEYRCPPEFEGPGPLGRLTLHDEFTVDLGASTAVEAEAGQGLVSRASRAPGGWQRLQIEFRPAAEGDPANPERAAGGLRIERFGATSAGPLALRNVRIEARSGPGGARTAGPWVDLLAEPERFTRLGGRAKFRIEDGVLIGETRPNTPNTFFTSRDTWSDFELLYEFNVHPELNSGVQIRSQLTGEIDERDTDLSGYQVEIDPSERAWSAGIYEERGRGWLHPLVAAPYARRAFRQGEWNRVRVLAEGPRLRTWINGVPAADVTDARAADGHLGFQVHGVGDRKEPLSVRWRKVRLRELR